MEDYSYTYETLEKMLLKKCLTDKKYLGIMSEHFDSRWFEGKNPEIAIMKLAIFYLKKNNKIPPKNALKLMARQYCEKKTDTKLSEIEERLMELENFTIPEDEMVELNLERYIKEKGYYYAICDNITSIREKGEISKCMDRFDRINKILLRDDNMGLNYFSKEGQQTHWDYILNPEAKISTGWQSLDFNTNGGFLKDGRMLALFVGQPGLGKSLFLSNIAVNFLAQNKTVVVISLEMSENVYCSRFSSIISEDNINKLKSSYASTRKKIDDFYAKHPQANLIVKEYPPSSIRVVDVERYLEKLRDNGTHIDVIVIDYLNLLMPNSKEDSMYMAIKKVAEQLRALSYKFNAPVISATQSNREGTNNEHIDITNISESTGQSQTADWIGLLYRSDDDRMNHIINMRVGKNRFGEPGKIINFQLNPQSLKLTDVTFSSNTTVTQSEADIIANNLEEMNEDMSDL